MKHVSTPAVPAPPNLPGTVGFQTQEPTPPLSQTGSCRTSEGNEGYWNTVSHSGPVSHRAEPLVGEGLPIRELTFATEK